MKYKGGGKDSIGNVEAKEIIFMTHRHELREWDAGWNGGAGQRGIKMRKKMGLL